LVRRAGDAGWTNVRIRLLQRVIDFDAGSVTVPDMPPFQPGDDTEGFTRFSTTFTSTGTLTGFADPSLAGTSLFSTELMGGGRVNASFSNYPPESGIRVLQLDYHFDEVAPIPEPGSLLLFGSGAAWVAARRRRRRQDRTMAEQR